MALTSTAVAVIGAVIAAYGVHEQGVQAEKASEERSKALREQKLAQAEQKATNAAQAAAERRQAIREERVKRARIIQASENTGVGFSSGVSSGIGSLSTQLGSNLGTSAGIQRNANNISDYNQTASGFLSSAENKISQANMWGTVGNMGISIFQGAGGFKTLGIK